MDILDCAHLKLKFCSLIWRHVQLRLSYEYHWTKHNEVAVLSITRNRRRSLFSKVDCILLDQILLDSSTYLLPPSSHDLHRLRFCLQNGEKTFDFLAPDEVTYEMWRVAIVDAISETAEMEQRFQTASFIDIDVKKMEKDGDVMLEKLDQAKVYIRDATNCKLIRLHRPVAFIAGTEYNLEQALDGIQCEITAAKKTMLFRWLLDAIRHEYPHCNNSISSEEDDVDATVSVDALAFVGHLVAAGRQHKFPDNHEEIVFSVSSHTAIISGNHEQTSANTVVRSFSDGEEEMRDLATPLQTEVYLHTVFSTSATVQRSRSCKPTARELLRRRLMETGVRKNGMVPCHSTVKQPEEELDGIFDSRYTVHPYLNFA